MCLIQLVASHASYGLKFMSSIVSDLQFPTLKDVNYAFNEMESANLNEEQLASNAKIMMEMKSQFEPRSDVEHKWAVDGSLRVWHDKLFLCLDEIFVKHYEAGPAWVIGKRSTPPPVRADLFQDETEDMDLDGDRFKMYLSEVWDMLEESQEQFGEEAEVVDRVRARLRYAQRSGLWKAPLPTVAYLGLMIQRFAATPLAIREVRL